MMDSTHASFETVVMPHLDAAFNLARWLVRNPDAAQDVAQDAVMRALAYYASFKGTNPKAWLLQIVRNTAYGAMKHRHGLELVPLDNMTDGETLPQQLHDPGDSPERALIRARDRESVARLLESLPAELREVLVLREIEDLSYRDIADITGAPIGTVMSRLWRARQLVAAAVPAELRSA